MEQVPPLEELTPSLAGLAASVHHRAQAEWREWSDLLDHVDAEEARVRANDSHPLLRESELSFISMDVATALHWSEGQVHYRTAQARRVRDHTPSVWEAFSQGRIDGTKAREISGAIEKLERPESIARLDSQVVAFAESHTLAELRRWLRLFIARVESDLVNERAEKERADRNVRVEHGDNGMGWMTIFGPSFILAAVDKRATKEAKALGEDDERTLEQRRFDLMASWLTTNEAGEAALHAHIAVTMPASAVAGSDDAPAVAADGSWVVPVQWMLDLAKHGDNNLFWHRMILEPITDDVLAHEYRGRFAPRVLAQALEFRDGVCQAAGCCKPSHRCDLDHRIPHEAGGPTAAWNLGSLCRRHHKAKGFGLLAIRAPSTLHHVGIPDVRPEQRVLRLLSYAR